MRALWGTGEIVKVAAPSLAVGAPDPGFLARNERLGASPTVAAALVARSLRSDIRDLAGSVAAPTMVVQTGDNTLIPVELSRDVADRIGGAVFLEAL